MLSPHNLKVLTNYRTKLIEELATYRYCLDLLELSPKDYHKQILEMFIAETSNKLTTVNKKIND